ncbi:MAG: hypothetical protein M1834_003667 [Cirrosporium novae-zelandiae]|nr:MAG: hypothetical protein M1834_003667 [Cirrosporium novae-zelandiae]
MAPKPPPALRYNSILTYFHTSQTCHTLRDLEKALPPIASIASIQVKEYLQTLLDENKIRVEKIGSGNWYWSFLSEGKRERERVLKDLRGELEKVERGLRELAGRVEEMVEEGEQEDGGTDGGRGVLVEKKEELGLEVAALKKELEAYKSVDPVVVARMEGETMGFKRSAEMWTENIWILEERIKMLVDGDREALEGVRKELYGDEYMEGEGLRELA